LEKDESEENKKCTVVVIIACTIYHFISDRNDQINTKIEDVSYEKKAKLNILLEKKKIIKKNNVNDQNYHFSNNENNKEIENFNKK